MVISIKVLEMSNNEKFFQKLVFIMRKFVILVEEEKEKYWGKKIDYTVSSKNCTGQS